MTLQEECADTTGQEIRRSVTVMESALESRAYDPEAHVYTTRSYGRLPGSTDVIKHAGLVNTDYMSEEARWRGKCVHRAIELINKNELDWSTVDDSFIGYLRSYQKLILMTRFEVFGSEEPCFSTAYGCLPDLWGALDRFDTIIELKTGRVMPWVAFQTALQRRALMEDKGFKAVKRFGLQLMANGSLAKLEPFEDRDDDRRAMGLVDMFHWRLAHRLVPDWR